MRLEDQVCSLELSKKLNKLGVKQTAIWQWNSKGELCLYTYACKERDIYISAFTTAELIEKVEQSANEWSVGYNDSGCFYHFRKGERGSGNMIRECEQEESRFDSEATPFVNALAEWCVHLIQNGLMKP